MKQLIIFKSLLLLLFFTFSNQSFASKGDLHSTVTGPISLIDGELGWGAYGDVFFEAWDNIGIGLESGFFYWSDEVANISAELWTIPLLIGGRYYFRDVNEYLTPIVGLSLGTSIAHGSLSVGAASASDTTLVFQGHAYVGAYIGKEQKFMTTIRLGLVDDNFMVAPSIGYRF